jgi:hypothetical protein
MGKGINELLTQEGILQNGDTFKDVSSLSITAVPICCFQWKIWIWT